MLVDIGEGRVEDVHDLLVERADHLAQIALCLAHILHLGLEELMALAELGQLLHRQGIDWPDGRQLCLELCDPGDGVDPLRQLRYGCVEGVLRSARQVTSQGLDDRLPSDGRLDQVELGLLQPAPRRSELVLADRPLTAQLLEACPSGPHCLELATMAITER